MIYKKHFIVILVVILISLAFVACFNYVIDPAGLFRPIGYEDGIAAIVVSRRNVANITNYDERLVQKYVIKKVEQKIDVIALGSSRSMQIRSYLFPQYTFFNHSVSGASIEDYLAIIQMYKERNLLPQKVIIGLDPWVLNRESGQNRWQSLEDEYIRSCEQLGLSVSTRQDNKTARKYIELISMPYLKESYDQWKKPSRASYYATTQNELQVDIELADGSRSYHETYRNKSVNEARQEAIAYANADPIYALGNFQQLDNKSIIMFEAFINNLQKMNIEVVFFLPPYHPTVYQALANNPKYIMVFAVEKYFNDLARSRDIHVIGSYNPVECSLSEADFYDGMHPKTAAVEKLFYSGTK